VVWGSTGTGGFPGQPQKRRSRWLWWVYLGAGTASCIGFIIVAVKVHNRKFVRAAVVSVVACIVGLVSYEIWPPVEEISQNTSSESSTDLGTFSTSIWIIMGIWLGLIVYGHVLDRDYKKFLRDEDDANNLRWRSTRAQTQAFYARPTAGGAPAHLYVPPPAPYSRAPSAPPVDPLGAEADRYLATQPSGNAPGLAPPNAPVV
jgi:hypothetical protein